MLDASSDGDLRYVSDVLTAAADRSRVPRALRVNVARHGLPPRWITHPG
jgi:hypothetical protein